MRLFVGVRPVPEAIAHLAEALHGLTGTGPAASSAIRWVPAQRWHLTLAFLGEVDEDRVPRLAARLERAARRCTPVELQLRSGGHFGRTVLWVAVVGNVQPLERLAAVLRAAARHAGIAIEDQRAFRPHLTVARGRPGADLRPWATQLADYAGPTWTAARVAADSDRPRRTRTSTSGTSAGRGWRRRMPVGMDRDDDDMPVVGLDSLRSLPGRAARRFRERGGAALTRMLRLTGAAVAAYLVALVLLDDPRPVLAPLTALLIVQVTLVGTITDTARRILSVVAGVALAIVFAAFVGFSWWSLALLIAASIMVGQVLRLGPHLLEVPISAMLVLAVGGSEHAALDRVTATVVGAAVGLLVNVLFPPAVQTRTAGAAIEEYAKQLASLLDRVADEVGQRVTVDQVVHWLDEARHLANEVPRVERVLATVEESRRLNPRAMGTAPTGSGLRSGLEALEHAAVALRALYRSLADRARYQPDGARLYDEEIRGVFAALLGDLARAVRDFGALVRAEADDEGQPHPEELAIALDSAREARAVLTELLLVDPRADPQLWQLHGALLAAVDRVLRELDVEERARQREAQRRAVAEESTRTAIAVERLRSATKAATRSVTDAVTDAVTDLPYRRGARKSVDDRDS